ncbi:hypothetical protein P152DRAFT_463363 [Eremomyces bilateralis CBS 781.70]|uniref:DUF7603 domain-containing protein n=1 Tax=Eremomyces bilateralis CBS 781.70 TaxID=1392243 RepID=A0A6G1GGK9_9PEZI|nr:uncharacterized protein P152DRAFT_463363 [Eremomyces bilateralis CBS 781.70]KAF1817066.1 hypothetical protein P152DRAFT_463363 [Eremomyces bilateralis CBS 781.70]
MYSHRPPPPGASARPVAPFPIRSNTQPPPNATNALPPRKSSLPSVQIPSFSSFRAQTANLPITTGNQSPIRRKPLPPNASPIIAARYSSGEYISSSKVVIRKTSQRSLSVDSPSADALPPPITVLPPLPSGTETSFAPRDLDQFPHGFLPTGPPPSSRLPDPPKSIPNIQIISRQASSSESANNHGHSQSQPSIPDEASSTTGASQPPESGRSSTMGSYGQKGHGLSLRLDHPTRTYTEETLPSPISPNVGQPLKSPGQKISEFFSWKPTSQTVGQDSPTTTFSGSSPASPASPHFSRPPMHHYTQSRLGYAVLDGPTSNGATRNGSIASQGGPVAPHDPEMAAKIDALERELKEVTEELAGSIKREMELEDEVERWKSERDAFSTDNRRTSDYYSDSGASSVRYPTGDSDVKIEQLERLRRQAEQEKARLKVDMNQRLQEETQLRREVEEQLQIQAVGAADNQRLRELEGTLEDTRRRLAVERQQRENFEDLYTALRQDLEQLRSERDNLRDEVVPHLRARVEGLEAAAAEAQTLSYENSRMQQEVDQLRKENQTLITARKLQMEMQQQASRFNMIAEERSAPGVRTSIMGLAHSNSLARNSTISGRRGTLSRSNSVKERDQQTYSDRVKDIEEQRDALHQALKSLLDRQAFQAKEHTKRIRALEQERDEALNAAINLTPRRTAFHREVTDLKGEVTHLRRRAYDALDQKLNCEKGLSGLKMDLDRAQLETASLRALLQENDISIPESFGAAESASLHKAYNELRTTHALSIARVKEMESDATTGHQATTAEAERTMALLKASISSAETERDTAMREAEEYRKAARALQASEISHLAKEQTMAADLYASAQRMDELASQVQSQIQSNSELRHRLAEAINRGEREQRASAAKIVEMQGKLRQLEDHVMAAQSHSETIVAEHEDEVRWLRESQSAQLLRVKSSIAAGSRRTSMMSRASAQGSGSQSPNPLFALRSPRLDKTSSGPGISMAEAGKTEALERRVEDLERALREAEREMGDVVGRMNMAQIEVAELQSER